MDNLNYKPKKKTTPPVQSTGTSGPNSPTTVSAQQSTNNHSPLNNLQQQQQRQSNIISRGSGKPEAESSIRLRAIMANHVPVSFMVKNTVANKTNAAMLVLCEWFGERPLCTIWRTSFVNDLGNVLCERFGGMSFVKVSWKFLQEHCSWIDFVLEFWRNWCHSKMGNFPPEKWQLFPSFLLPLLINCQHETRAKKKKRIANYEREFPFFCVSKINQKFRASMGEKKERNMQKVEQ